MVPKSEVALMPHGSKMPTFTTRWLESIKVTVQTDFVDRSEPGLMFRVMPSGIKSWSLLYRRTSDNKRRRLNLGRFPEMGLAAARSKAVRLKEAIADGADPAGKDEVKTVETVDQLVDRFLIDYTNPGPRWKTELARIFAKDVRPAIGRLKIDKVTRKDILAVVNAVKDRGAGVSANRTLAALRKLFNWAVSEGYLEVSPASNIPQRVKEVPRDRALSESEIRSFWTGLDSADMAPNIKIALRLALVLGQRIGEICSATWAEVDLDRAEWVIPASKTKNKREHMVPLSPLAVELFRGEISSPGAPIFPARRLRHIDPHGVAMAMRRSLPVLGLHDNPATPHDLRRTVASQLAAMGIGENVVARVLNHASEIGKTITGAVYIRHNFAAEKRHALEVWAGRLDVIVSGRDLGTNIVKIGRTA
jgi:integrase